MPGTSFKIESPQLAWTEDGLPRSTAFDDIYYSDQDPLRESEHVFLHGCELERQWSDASPLGHSFQVGEIGFGGGLNFLMTWSLWERHKANQLHPGRLHYTAVEKYPLSPADMARLHERWPELKLFSARLLDCYKPVHQGLMRLKLGDDITLDLVLDDAANWLATRATSNPQIPAWFLDGFSPAQNEELWSLALFRLIATHSTSNTRLATYSSAGRIRRDLENAGFRVERTAGYGRKRHMLVAKGLTKPAATSPSSTPWFEIPRRECNERHAIVIGAGLAGCFTAYALAQRDWQVELLDAAAAVASGASGIPQLALRCRLFNASNSQARFFLQAYSYCLQILNTLSHEGDSPFRDCGVLQMASAMNARQGLRAESVKQMYPTAIVAVDEDGNFLFPGAGWVDSHALCTKLISHPRITFRGDCSIAEIDQAGSDPKRATWRLYDNHGKKVGESSVLVLSNGFDAARLIGSHNLPLQESLGQCSQFASTAELAANSRVLCDDKTLFPAMNGMHTVSATYRKAGEGLGIRAEDNARNQQALAEMLDLDRDKIVLRQSQVGSRCASPDRFPLVGPVPTFETMAHDFAELRRNARAKIDKTPHYQAGLFINTAHGSNGMCSIPLCAEFLASLIEGESSPLDRSMMATLNPARFLIQDLKKQR